MENKEGIFKIDVDVEKNVERGIEGEKEVLGKLNLKMKR